MATIELDTEYLERIAEYYEFPYLVFFGGDKKIFTGKTRVETLSKKADLYDKIKEIVEGE